MKPPPTPRSRPRRQSSATARWSMCFPRRPLAVLAAGFHPLLVKDARCLPFRYIAPCISLLNMKIIKVFVLFVLFAFLCDEAFVVFGVQEGASCLVSEPLS